ncbi:MAG: UDP-N-acetylmuramate dehydrogenase [Chlamydiales bacterium]|nr:UDP-N-acetylmuramate dehydrogenase [Chlamydiales bacterium]
MISYDDFKKNELLSKVSTFRLGGPADYCIEARDIETLIQVLHFCKSNHLDYFVIGKGSNCLFSDLGFRGLVIINKIDFMEVKKNRFRVGAGYSFSLLGSQTARLGFSGLEFAAGIPASVGGAVFMNAGANGKEVCESLESVEYVSNDGDVRVFEKDELTFGYRKSSFQEMRGVIVAATFKLEECKLARGRQLEIIQYRKKTQPLNEPSAGCVFQNPKGQKEESCLSAGKLIEMSELKGISLGGVKVSEKHANFIVNTGSGSAQDVLRLVQLIKSQVKEKMGIELREEIRLIGEKIEF